jgi:hypothetical protein
VPKPTLAAPRSILTPRLLSETGQEGEGRKVGVPCGSRLETCPVRTLKTSLEVAGISTDPLFREINRRDRLMTAHSDKQDRQRGMQSAAGLACAPAFTYDTLNRLSTKTAAD